MFLKSFFSIGVGTIKQDTGCHPRVHYKAHINKFQGGIDVLLVSRKVDKLSEYLCKSIKTV